MAQIGVYTKTLPTLSDGVQVPAQVDARGRLIVSSGDNAPSGVLTVTTVDLDTSGNIVPTWKAHAFTYDTSGNLQTDTVSDGVSTWIRTFQWGNGVQTGDSGWVKQ